MKTQFNTYYFTAFCALLLIEIAIALYIKGGFIRHTVGDFLVVALLYCFVKSFLNIKPLPLAITVLLFSFCIEFLQLANLLEYLKLRDNKFIAIVFGTSFSVQDLIAYTFGALAIWSIDTKIIKMNLKK